MAPTEGPQTVREGQIYYGQMEQSTKFNQRAKCTRNVRLRMPGTHTDIAWKKTQVYLIKS